MRDKSAHSTVTAESASIAEASDTTAAATAARDKVVSVGIAPVVVASENIAAASVTCDAPGRGAADRAAADTVVAADPPVAAGRAAAADRAASDRAASDRAASDRVASDGTAPAAPARTAPAASVELRRAEVGTWNERFVVSLRDRARVEAVLYRGDTLCISSQVGCAVSCPFCASGQNGFGRNLSLDELVGQITSIRALGHSLRRVTVSGVGEPLHNRAVTELLAWCSRERLGLSLTTSGGPVQRLREWLHAPHNGLTLSVHAGTEATRAKMVPHGPSLDSMFGTLAAEFPKMNGRRRKKTALAYLLVNGTNDADADLDAFAARVAPLGLRVHLYAYNAVEGLGFSRVPRARYESAYERLTRAGLRVSMSSQARIEANGGCGTLVALRTP